jgi:hypothetical protein
MTDKESIDQIISVFFSIFTNTRQQQPDWKNLYNVCITETIIIKKSGLKEEVYTLDSFIEPRKKILSDGTLTEFEEKETAEETRITGRLAQRFSRYEKTGYLTGNEFHEQGHKFFQLIKTAEGWKINSVIWEDDLSK